ncbi:MAG: transglutaminase domain-containing protein, partial [Flavobacteriales bacterium]|nr:transglutaminase domain-containing protein [Flavobacteriales bacterium]
NTASPEDFAKYWQDFTATHFQIYTESLTKYAEEKNINDWGVYKLIENSADALFTDNNNKNMWMWAMLNQSGYYVKIGYYKNETYLLLPFLQDVYEKPYYNINGNKYYIINDAPNDKKLFTYAESFGGATKSIDLNLIKSLNFRDETNTVVKTTQLPNQDNPISLKLNQTTISFLASYPQTEKSVYLNSVISSNIKDDLYEALAEEIKGKNETEAVAYLLNYLHNSFDYKTDIEQFGNERMFFPDEIFYYPYSDCEDRAVLFADLVNSLVGLDVVATTYPNHMATAVAFTEQVEGVYYVVDGRNFTVCDPTYLNAPIGAVMPQFENVSPRITRINTEYNFMWQEIANKIEKGNKGKIFIKDKAISENGNYIISGWFNDDITVNGQEYSATNKTRDLWFATFNTKGNMEWFLPVKSTGFSFSQAFNVSANGSVYTLINYTGAIGIDRSTVFKKENGYLILGINNNGTTFLSEDLGIESKGVGKFAFYGKYSQTGEKINLVSFPTDEIAFDTEITIDSNNDIMVKGITGEVEGLTKKITALSSETSFSAEKQINSYMNKYIELKFDPKMAGVFASIKLLSQNGSSISGDDIKSLLDNNTPNFKNNNPSLYKSLSRMKFVINKGGIVKIQTQNGKDVSLDAMNIENSSNMQIIKVSENTYKLKFLNGVEVGKSFIWFDLNSVTLHNDGTIIFDYAKGHTKKEVSISSIID